MTPLDTELLQGVGMDYLELVTALSVYGFFYGASSLHTARDSSTTSISGVFLVIFAASAVIFAFVFYF